MKKHDQKRALKLTAETIRRLEQRDLAAIAGGVTAGSGSGFLMCSGGCAARCAA